MVQSNEVSFQFVNVGSNARLKRGDQKNIRSHAARGSGRPKQSSTSSKPHVGAWIRLDSPSSDLDVEIPRSLSIFPGMTGAALETTSTRKPKCFRRKSATLAATRLLTLT